MCDNFIMQRIGIFGGTFNPVHAEHLNIAKNAVKELGLNFLYVMPTFLPPHKDTLPAPASDRINMLKIAFSGMPKIEISDYEVQKGGKSYTFQTVEHFKDDDTELFFIIGGDMLTDFKNWKNPQRILDCCKIAVFEREGFYTDFEGEKEYFKTHFGKDFIKLSYVGKKVSSTKVRVYSTLGLNTDGLTIPLVADYIREKDLYCSSDYVEFLKANLSEKRLIHTANVAVLAMDKVKELSLDAEKVMTACILHDVAKYLKAEDFSSFNLPKDVPPPVVHAFLGAFVAEHLLGISDKEILDAIRYHTSGRAKMSKLEKLVFVADMLEEGRDYDGVDKLREFYKGDLDTCFEECLKEEVIHLKNKGQKIYGKTLEAFDYYVKGE